MIACRVCIMTSVCLCCISCCNILLQASCMMPTQSNMDTILLANECSTLRLSQWTHNGVMSCPSSTTIPGCACTAVIVDQDAFENCSKLLHLLPCIVAGPEPLNCRVGPARCNIHHLLPRQHRVGTTQSLKVSLALNL